MTTIWKRNPLSTLAPSRMRAVETMRVFLSYSTPDQVAADRLRQALSTRRPGLDVYFAPRRNELGAYWIERLGTELEAADAVILLLGSHVGPWQELEYYEALRRNRRSGRPLVLPILVSDAEPGMPFLDQFHRLSLLNHSYGDLIELALQALDGSEISDATPPWRLVNPYRGLPAMGTQDAAFFFGREDVTGEILRRISAHSDRIHVLVGNSGVGKSSIALAGVLAALKSRLWPADWDREWPETLSRSHTWPAVTLKPGETPVKTLAQACAGLWLESPAEIEEEALKWRRLLMGESSLSALVDAALFKVSRQADAEAPERIFLYVDQGEELYSQAGKAEAHRFSELLAEAVTRPELMVMISLRSDYYGCLQEDAPLFHVSDTIDVTPLDRPDIERIIRLPADRLQVRFDNPDMISAIAESTAREPGSMPMLSDLLADTWRAMAHDSQADGVLRFPSEIFDISRPLADKAERFFAAHEAEENALRRLFTLKLSYVPKEGEVVRRRARRAECTDEEWALAEVMAQCDWRLLTTGEEGGSPVAEVAHEALLRNWPRVARWLDTSREFLVWKGQFEADRRAWEAADEDERPRALLTGLRLDIARRWLAERSEDLSDEEKRFISESERAVAEAQARELEAATRLARQRRWIQRLALSALIVVSLVAAFALWQRKDAIAARDQAVEEQERAQRQTELAIARRLATEAERVLEENIGETSLAGLLAAESLRRSPTVEAKQLIRRVLSLTPGDFREVETPWPRSEILHSPDGKLTVFSRRSKGWPSDWNPASGVVGVVNTRSWNAPELYRCDGASWPVLSPDGRWLATAGYGRRLRVMDLQRNRKKIVDVHQDDMFDAAFGPDGRVLFVARTDGVIEVREAPEWRITRTLSYPLNGRPPGRVGIDVSPDGQRILILARTTPPYLVPTRGGLPVKLEGQKEWIADGGFSSSGEYIFTQGGIREVRIWNVESGALQGSFDHDAKVTAVAISPDDSRFVVATRVGTVLVRDLQTGKVLYELAHKRWVNAVAFSPDGNFIATASDDGSAALWNFETGDRLLNLAHDDEVWSIAFGEGGRTVLTGGKDGALRVFDATTGAEMRRIQFKGGVRAIAHEPDSGALAVSILGTRHDQAWTDLLFVDRKTGTKVARLQHNGGFFDMVFSPDGRTLATSSGGTGEVKIWDTDTGTLRVKPDLRAGSLFFSPDSTRLIAINSRREAVIVDVFDGRLLATLGEPGGVVKWSVGPDDRTIVTFGKDRLFRGWDAITGEELWKNNTERPDESLELSSDGKRFADFSTDGLAIEMGETRNGRNIATIPAKGSASSSLQLSGDGQRLLVTRVNVRDPSDPDRRCSEIEMWDVDSGQRLFARRLDFKVVHAQFLPGGRLAIAARPSSKYEPKGFFEVMDADRGERLWTSKLSIGFADVLVPDEMNDVLVLKTGARRQVRDVATGKLIFEAAGGYTRKVATSRDRSMIVFGSHQDWMTSDEYAIEIRTIESGDLLHKIPISEYIRDIAISVDGQFLLAAIGSDSRDSENCVRIWRTADWSEIRTIEPDGLPRELVPLADPDLFAVHDDSDTLRVWRISTGEEEYRFSHTFTATGVAVSSDADRAVTWRGASIRVWDSRNGTEIAHRLSHGKVTSLAVSPDGRTVAYLTDQSRTSKRGGDFRALALWEPESDEEPIVLPMEAPREVLFDPAGGRIIVGHRDNRIQILDLATLRTTGLIRSLPGAEVDKIAFDAEAELLFIREKIDLGGGRYKAGLRAFELDSLREVARVDGSMFGELLTPTHGSREVTTSRADGPWHSWTVKSTTLDELLWAVSSLEIGLNRSSWRFHVYLKDPDSGHPPTALRDLILIVPKVDGEYVPAWTDDVEAGLLAGLTENGAVISAADDGRQLARWTEGPLYGRSSWEGKDRRPVCDLAFLDKGESLVMYDTPGEPPEMSSRLWLWRWRAGAPKMLSAQNHINMIAVSPAGNIFASAEGLENYDSDTGITTRFSAPQIRIWDARTGKEIRKIAAAEEVYRLAFSPDGALLAGRTGEGVIVYRVKDWTKVAAFDFEGADTNGAMMRFGLGGRRIVAAAAEGVWIWALDGAESRLLLHEKGWPWLYASADGRLLATSTGNFLRVWNVETGAKLFELEYTDRKYLGVAFAGVDNDLIAETDAGLVRIRWKSEDLISELCRRVNRNPTPDEWRRFLDDEPPPQICPDSPQLTPLGTKQIFPVP